MRRFGIRLGLLLGAALALVGVAVAGAASITVAPSTVPVGGTVTVSGDVLDASGQAGCALPGTVTLISPAFAGQGSFMNEDVETTAGADGKFSVQATILAGVAPGTYTITGRCGGGNLGVQATLVVTPAGLPSTGSGGVANGNNGGTARTVLPPALLLAGLLLAATGRRIWRNSTRAHIC